MFSRFHALKRTGLPPWRFLTCSPSTIGFIGTRDDKLIHEVELDQVQQKLKSPTLFPKAYFILRVKMRDSNVAP